MKDDEREKKHRKDDILWKVVIEEVFEDPLRFIFPDADKTYDLARGFEFLEKELAEMYPEPAKETKTRFADKLVKVYTRKNKQEWVLCHVEIQGETKGEERPLFADRMFRYFIRIWDRNYPSPVSAVAIFTGPDAGKMPKRFIYEYRKTRLHYHYHTVSVLDFTDKELEENENPFAQVILAARTSLLEERIPESELLDKKISIAKRLLAKGYSQRKIRAIFVFLENSILFEDPEMNRIFKERIQSYDKANIMGIDEYLKQVAREEGLAEGLTEGEERRNRLFVENLLKEGFSDEKIASLAGVSFEFISKVKENLQVS